MGIPRQTPRTLKAGWGSSSESHNDLHYVWGEGIQTCDARLLNSHLPELVKELEKRGYDLKTLRFSVKLKAPETQPAPHP